MIWIYPDLEALSHAAAGLLAQQARHALQATGRFSVALSGSSTPQRTYRLLAEKPLRDDIAWENVHVFWGDERCVPSDDPRSNAHMARRSLLDHVPIPPEQIHPIPCRSDPEEAAREYERTLHTFFAGRPPHFDVVLLGIGEDGHIASLFPGTDAVRERRRWVAAVYPEGMLRRVTLTLPVINLAHVIIFLVAGETKAAVLRRVLEGPSDAQDLPAKAVEPLSGTLHWLVDRDAAALLTRHA